MLTVAYSSTHSKLAINHAFNNKAIALNSFALVISLCCVIDTKFFKCIVFAYD